MNTHSKMGWLLLVPLLVGLTTSAVPVRAQSTAAVPSYEGEFFSDLTHQLPAKDKVQIGRTLRVAAQTSMIHPMLVVIDKMATYPQMPQDIKQFATKLATEWKVGEVSTHKGVLALFSIEDRKFFVAKSTNLDQQIADQIASGFKGRVTDLLKSNNLPQAMTVAADAMATALPPSSSTANRTASGTSANGSTTSSTPGSHPGHTVTRTTREHRVGSPVTGYGYPNGYTPHQAPLAQGYAPDSSSSGHGWLFWIGMAFVGIILFSIVSSLFGSRGGYAGGGSNYYGGPGMGYGGGGYGGGGGGGGFLSGLMSGGLMGYMFGNHGSSSSWFGGSHSSYGAAPTTGDYTDTTTTETWADKGGDVGGGGGDGGGSGMDTFGGGDYSGGGGSDGSW